MTNGPVVVGYDQTPHSDHALAEAVREAANRGTALKIVHAYTWIPPVAPMAEPTQIPVELSEQACREAAEKLARQAADDVRDLLHFGHTVEAHAVAGHPAKVLADASRGADLLVVGSRGRGGFTGLLLGSVSLRVLADACCPVVVVHDQMKAERRRVVMAVDIEAPCEEILEYAFTEASRRGADLMTLHVRDEPWIAIYGGDEDAAVQVKQITADYEARLDCLVRSWHAKFPDVRTELRIVIGTAATALVEATDRADLIVVGGRRHGDGRHGMRIGPVANTVLHHSACPVAVVPLG